MHSKIISFSFFFFLSLFAYSQTNVFDAARKGDTVTLNKLLNDESFDINQSNASGHTILILAAYNKQIETLKWALKNGAEVDYKTPQGTALHGAAYKGFTNIAELLIAHKANVNAKDANGTTPLIYATLFKHIALAELLISKGADPSIQDQTGSSALTYAQDLELTTLISLFKEHHP